MAARYKSYKPGVMSPSPSIVLQAQQQQQRTNSTTSTASSSSSSTSTTSTPTSPASTSSTTSNLKTKKSIPNFLYGLSKHGYKNMMNNANNADASVPVLTVLFDHPNGVNIMKKTQVMAPSSGRLPGYDDAVQEPPIDDLFGDGDELPDYSPPPENRDEDALVSGYVLVKCEVPIECVKSFTVSLTGTVKIDMFRAANSRVSVKTENIDRINLFQEFNFMKRTPNRTPPSNITPGYHKFPFLFKIHHSYPASVVHKFYSVSYVGVACMEYVLADTAGSSSIGGVISDSTAGNGYSGVGSSSSSNEPVSAASEPKALPSVPALTPPLPAPPSNILTTRSNESTLQVNRVRSRDAETAMATFSGCTPEGLIVWEASLPAECGTEDTVKVSLMLKIATGGGELESFGDLHYFVRERTMYKVPVLLDEDDGEKLVLKRLVDDTVLGRSLRTKTSIKPNKTATEPITETFNYEFELSLKPSSSKACQPDMTLREVTRRHHIRILADYYIGKSKKNPLGSLNDWVQGENRHKIMDIELPIVVNVMEAGSSAVAVVAATPVVAPAAEA
ncbi:hypothetical protein HDU76_008925, partial [Blyttiomyces sp. JEL0837]